MPRIPYAAAVLISQVTDAKPRTRHEIVGPLDGIGVFRTIRFSKSGGKWLAPLLEEIRDPRIQSIEWGDDDYLEVTFVSTGVADRRHPFPLGDAETVLG